MEGIDRYSVTPLYVQLADAVRARIEAGEWSPGDAMPSERQFSEDYGVGRPTARKALAVLEDEGLVVVLPQRGVFRKP